MATLIFIDTSIFLDFYRVRGRQGDLSILSHIDDNHDRIITSSQVEMEFKKNRPRVILEAFESLKAPNWAVLQLPAFLASSKQSSGLDTGRKRIDEQLKTLRTRMVNVFRQPTRYDSVYKVAQRLFRADTPYNLSREKRERFAVRRLAWRRFILGYPPRKPSETSIGDSLHWEWLIKCAEASGSDVVIVSRDSDFGLRFDDSDYINDWLRQEFRERISQKRKIHLTERLAKGLQMASISVSQAEEAAERRFLEERPRATAQVPLPPPDDWARAFHTPADDLAQLAKAFKRPTEEIRRAIDAMGEAIHRPQRELARALGIEVPRTRKEKNEE